MRFNILYKKSVTFLALFILVACGGGSSSPTLLTWPSFSAFEVVENSNGSWSIAATINKGAQISYAIEPSADSGSFALSGSALSLNLSPNYEQPLDANKDGVYELVLSAKSLGQTATRSINVRVTDISEAPIISTLSIDNISENLAVISTIEAFDEDANSSILFSLIDSAGSKDEDLLSIDSKSGALTFKITPNYEIPSDLNLDNTINFSVLVSDGSLSTQSDYSFSIIDINEAPLISTDTIDAILKTLPT